MVIRYQTLILFFSFLAPCYPHPASKPAFKSSSSTSFIENKGQIIDQHNKPNPGVLYLLNTPGFNVQLRKGGFSYDVYQVHNQQSSISSQDPESGIRHPASDMEHPASTIEYHRIDIDLLNANPNPRIEASEPSSDYFNYFTASTPSEGIKNVRQYAKVIYKEIYPGIDLEFFTNDEHRHKYNFVIHPGANINNIRLKINGPDHISLIQDTLKFGTRFGDLEELIPESYYIVNDSRIDIKARFTRINNEFYGFSINNPVPENSLLVIDPTAIRLWGTYYGGTGWDGLAQCSTDRAGNIFLAGETNSPNNIASSGSYQGILAGNFDDFLAKFNTTGQRQWGTYFGGTDYEDLFSCFVDKSGNIYISGSTKSTSGIASAGAHQTVYGGGLYDCFIEKFNQAGDRLWGTYYGGAGNDNTGTVTTDNNRNVFLSGTTISDTGIATPGSYQINRHGSTEAFLAKFDSNGIRQWGTYFGGELGDNNMACTSDGLGNVYFAGVTSSHTNIASPGAYQTTYGGGIEDAFLVKFSTEGQRIWATYYGGLLDDRGFGCASDNLGNVCLVGETNSLDSIASSGCFQPIYGGGGYDAFIVKFDSNGVRHWGTYYGGGNFDEAYGCSIGWNNEIFMAGFTLSADNISTPNSYQSVLAGSNDGFIVKFNSAGQRQWGSYYGGSMADEFLSCTYVPDDTLYLAGYTSSIDSIANQGSWQQVYGGTRDDMLIKFLDCWPFDTVGPILGSVNICKPTTSLTYSIPPLIHAVNYIWTLPPGITITSGVGTASIIVNISNSAISGTIWVKVLNKCNTGDSASLYVTVGQAPVPVINGPNNTCAGTGKVYTTAFGKTNYQWSVSAGGVITAGGTTTDNTVTVTWNAIGTQHVYVNYTDANGCSADTPTDYIVTVTPSPIVNITITATSNNVCSGTQVTFNSTASNGGGNPFYQWQVNGINIGAGSSSFSYTPINNDIVRCILTSSITGCIMNNPDTSNSITMIINPILTVNVSISASENPFCQGSTITFTAIPTNEGTTPSYQWKVNGGNVGSSSTVYSYVPNNGDIVSCVLNSSVPCPTGNLATSNSIAMVENTNVVVSLTILPSANPVCAGSSVSYTATPTNGGTTPVYQWKVNGIIVGTNNPVYSYIPVNGDIITCILTSNALCASGNPATSNALTMILNPLNPVSISISPSANPVCSGTSVTYTAIPGNGGSAPVYLWKVNGINVGTNTPVYSYIPVSGDQVSCTLTSNILCPTGNPATSNTINMTVNPNLPVSISISASANPFCQGASVTFSATPTNGGAAPSYQWKVNGGNVGPDNPVYLYSPNNGDIVSCVLTSNVVCPTGNPATSNSITMIVNANLPAGINISASTNPFCPGNSVTFTAIPANGGINPAYQWKVDGANAGTNSSIFTYIPLSGDLVSCILTSNLVCVTGNPATSNTIIMSGTLAPVVTFILCDDTITTTNAKPFKLKGGIPLGGTYSGAGVAGGILNPAIAGVGNHQITYTYTNAALCAANAHSILHIFNPSNLPCGSPLTDIRDSKVYPTIQISAQCWMAANLDYGNLIPGNTSQRDNCIWEKYCYNDVAANCGNQTYYQWDELMQFDETVSTQGFCPPGWHVPTEADWNTLFTNYISNGFAGSPLKYSGFSGFNAILSGARHFNKNWDYQGFATFFWSSTSHGASKAWAHGMNDVDPSVSIYPAYRSNAMSVRCVHD